MKQTKGFSLVELMVMVAVIALLSGVIYSSVSSSRAKARDAIRVEDIKELSYIFELYYQENGADPACDGGIVIADIDIDALSSTEIIEQLVHGMGTTNDTCTDAVAIYDYIRKVTGGSIPTDPLGPGNPDYFYYYDGGHNCDMPGTDPTIMDIATMVFAVNLEEQESNVLEKCTTVSGSDGGFVQTTDGDIGGTITSSKPYLEIIKRVING